MKKVKGLNINHLGFTPVKLGDFLYYEGPLLSHFTDRDKPDDHYFYRWVDNDDDTNRWLISKFTERDLVSFFKGDLSLRQLITNNVYVILLDLDDHLNKNQILLMPTSDLPDNYLPIQQSFFEEKYYQTYAVRLKQQLLQKQQEQSLLTKLWERVVVLEEQQRKTLQLLKEWRFS
jgi:hypothetical protein